MNRRLLTFLPCTEVNLETALPIVSKPACRRATSETCATFTDEGAKASLVRALKTCKK